VGSSQADIWQAICIFKPKGGPQYPVSAIIYRNKDFRLQAARFA